MDYSGQIFGNIKVLKRADGDLDRCRKSLKETGRTTDPKYTCECLLCGKIFDRNMYAVKKNKFKNCGCQSLQYDLTNKKFGKLTAIKPIGMNKHSEMNWECVCDCGNKYISTSYGLRKGYSTQCKQCSNKQLSRKKTKYIVYSKRLKECYVNMKTRCTNKKQDPFNRYVNRGIDLCEEWKNDYSKFQTWALNSGYNENLTLDRIDNNKGYSPDNCRWVTRKEQANNRRTSLFLNYQGTSDTLANWSRKLNIPYNYIQYRIYKGKDLEEVVNEFNDNPRHKRKNKSS